MSDTLDLLNDAEAYLNRPEVQADPTDTDRLLAAVTGELREVHRRYTDQIEVGNGLVARLQQVEQAVDATWGLAVESHEDHKAERADLLDARERVKALEGAVRELVNARQDLMCAQPLTFKAGRASDRFRAAWEAARAALGGVEQGEGQ